MITLAGTTQKLQIVLGVAVTTNELSCFCSWADSDATDFEPDSLGETTSGITDKDIVPAPASGVRRGVSFISIYNTDTAGATVTIKIDVSGTENILWKGTLGVGERLEYSKDGFKTYNNVGALKTINANSSVPVGDMQRVILAADEVNNNAVANTLEDLTGLTFSGSAGETYYFRYRGEYTAALGSTGSRWTVSGSNVSAISYSPEYTLTATTTTKTFQSALQLPASCNATSLNTGNLATVEGFVTFSGAGSIQVQCASEVAGSAITAKAGAFLDYLRVI